MRIITSYIRSLNVPRSAIFNAWVLLGFFMNYHFSEGFDFLIFTKLLIVIASFDVFYGGIYTFNNLMDRSYDKESPYKRERIDMDKRIFAAFALFNISLPLSLMMVLDMSLFLLFVTFLLFNITYTLYLKKLVYVDVLANAVTHPLRIVLGYTILPGTLSPSSIIVLGAVYFLVVIGLSFRRLFEKRYEKERIRPTLKFYSARSLKNMMYFSLTLIFVLTFVRHQYQYIITTILFLGCIIAFNNDSKVVNKAFLVFY